MDQNMNSSARGRLVQSYRLLHEIIEEGSLHAVFQPLIDIGSGQVHGFEGLIRGPEGSSLHSPFALFKAATVCGLSLEVELLAQKTVLTRFAELGLPGRVFVNISPESFSYHKAQSNETLAMVRESGLTPDCVVIELTENKPTVDYRSMRDTLLSYRRRGFGIALDDLGEGFASLRLWSELQPDYVKIDMHFVQGVHLDSMKLQFLKAVQQIAQSAGSQLVAEGIENESELRIVRDLGISLGQGFFISRPSARPPVLVADVVLDILIAKNVSVYPVMTRRPLRVVTAEKLLIPAPPITPDTSNEQVCNMFEADKGLLLIPVVREDGRPLGLISRYRFFETYARPFRRELYGRHACEQFVNPTTLIVEKGMSIQDLTRTMADTTHTNLLDGLIITDRGHYAGIARGQDLLREITEMQIDAARHANPLTYLPGSVPAGEHIDRLLESGASFCACYCSLDNFKPFNDAYGLRRGDEMILLAARTLAACADPELDFVGHIGGDEFLLVFQSTDWMRRCHTALNAFDQDSRHLFSAEDAQRGGLMSEDRSGKSAFHPLTTLSIGAVEIEPGVFRSHKEISVAAAEAKRQAKKLHGSALFVERRRPRFIP